LLDWTIPDFAVMTCFPRAASAAALAVSLAAALPAAACPICAGGSGLTPAQRLVEVERALRGARPAREAQADPWLREAATLKGAAEVAAEDWPARLAFFLPRLEDPDPVAAEVAYGEVAQAPYAALRAARDRPGAERIAGWLDDPGRASRAPLYTLLLGMAGGDLATARVARGVRSAAASHDATNLAALLAADLELHGATRLPAIESTYLVSGDRSVPEVRAALLALSVQGGADEAVPRQRIVETYRNFAGTRHPLAGLAAADLRTWRAWDALPEFMALARARVPQHPTAEAALLAFLEASPSREAKSAAANWRLTMRP